MSLLAPSEKIRIGIIGDPGSGKSSFLSLLCQHKVYRKRRGPGFGLDVFVRETSLLCVRYECTTENLCTTQIHRTADTQKDYYVECVEVPGHCKNPKSASLIYPTLDGNEPLDLCHNNACLTVYPPSMPGLVLVHDLTNVKSYQNLRRWLNEITLARTARSSHMMLSSGAGLSHLTIQTDTDYSQAQKTRRELDLPVVLVGSKADLATMSYRKRSYSLSGEYRTESFDWVNSQAECAQWPHSQKPVPHRL